MYSLGVEGPLALEIVSMKGRVETGLLILIMVSSWLDFQNWQWFLTL